MIWLMDTKTLPQIVPQLREAVRQAQARRVTYDEIVSASGGEISRNWVAGFTQGAFTNPTMDKLIALANALESLQQGRAA